MKNILAGMSLSELEVFAAQNIWEKSDAKLSDRIASDFFALYGRSDPSTCLRHLELFLPALDPIRVINEYFHIFISILLNPQENLSLLDASIRITVNCLKSFIPESSPSQELKICAKKFLDCFVQETQARWNTVENLAAGIQPFTYQSALDPSQIPNLEQVLFSFGMAKPLLFYELLNDLAWLPDTRLHSFMLLKSFLILEDAPTYYLIDSELYKTVIRSAMVDSEASVFLTSITILTILLPIVATKAVSHLDDLTAILSKAIIWERSCPLIISQPSLSSHKSSEDIDNLLLEHSMKSVRVCINQYFTVLYGMFPCNVLRTLTWSHGETPSVSILDFKKALDPFEDLKANINEDTLFIKSRIQVFSYRIYGKELLAGHRCHFYSIGSNPTRERQNPWFITKDPSEIMVTCFSLAILDTQMKPMPNIPSSDSITNVAQDILRINRYLYGPSVVSLLVSDLVVIFRIVEQRTQN
jgi:hypothetical protein